MQQHVRVEGREVRAVETTVADLRRGAERVGRVEEEVAARALGAGGASAVASELGGGAATRHLRLHVDPTAVGGGAVGSSGGLRQTQQRSDRPVYCSLLSDCS